MLLWCVWVPVREMWDAATNFLHTRGLQLPFCPLDTLSPSLEFPSHPSSPKLGFYSSKPNWLLVSGRSQCKGTRSLSSLLPSHPCPPPPPPPLLSPAHNFTHFSPSLSSSHFDLTGWKLRCVWTKGGRRAAGCAGVHWRVRCSVPRGVATVAAPV